ncbi:MAG: hypothetical protein AAGU27_24100, partial [Dehalobacterium sp.]
KDKDTLFQGDFNFGQKIWYLIIISSFIVLGVTGIAKFGYFDEPEFLNNITIVHIIWAVAVDVGFLTHLYRKLISRNLLRYKQYTNKEYSLDFTEYQYEKDEENSGGIPTDVSGLPNHNTKLKSLQI